MSGRCHWDKSRGETVSCGRQSAGRLGAGRMDLDSPNRDGNSLFYFCAPCQKYVRQCAVPLFFFNSLDTRPAECHSHQVAIWTSTISRRVALSRRFRMAQRRYSVFETAPSRFSLQSSPRYVLLQRSSSRTTARSITLF